MKILFVGHKYHERTGSSSFIENLLSKEGSVTSTHVDYEAPDPWKWARALHEKRWDLIVHWQVMVTPSDKITIRKNDNLVLFPMADSAPSIQKPEKWWPYRACLIVNFSEKLDKQLKKIGLTTRRLHYAPCPQEVKDFGDTKSLFFWRRRNYPDCETVRALVNLQGIERIHIHNAPDPGIELQPLTFGPGITVSESAWFDRKEELTEKIKESAWYLAPRKKEGIGMSFLEAMAMGRCVAAADETTMNEIITHRINGYLLGNDSSRLNKDEIRAIQSKALESISKTRDKWNQDANQLLLVLNRQTPGYGFALKKAMTLRFFRNPVKVIRAAIEFRMN